jgi:hypothetical protein
MAKKKTSELTGNSEIVRALLLAASEKALLSLVRRATVRGSDAPLLQAASEAYAAATKIHVG